MARDYRCINQDSMQHYGIKVLQTAIGGVHRERNIPSIIRLAQQAKCKDKLSKEEPSKIYSAVRDRILEHRSSDLVIRQNLFIHVAEMNH